jgi:RES domain-containing protein
MVVAWRLVSAPRATDPWSGEGARRYGGRWNEAGVAALYTSEHRSLAALEVLVHLNGIEPSAVYKFLSYEIDDFMIESLPVGDLPAGWRQEPPALRTAGYGSQWVKERRSFALAVPSAVVPEERNIILNPDHPDRRKIRLARPAEFAFDPRLFA